MLVARTSARYAIRLYKAFKPLWWALHCWDELASSRLCPQWSFGFDTLVAYPDPDPEQTTVDGYVFRYSLGDWPSLRNGSGTGWNDSGSGGPVVFLQTNVTPYWYGMHRGILLFDTSAIGSDSSIDEAHLDLWCVEKYTLLGDTSVDLVSSWPQYNTQLLPADYQNLGTTLFGNLPSIEGVTLDQYNRITLNSSGRAAINKTGITKFGLRLGWDRVNYPPLFQPHSTTFLSIRFAEHTGTDNDPRLTVIYTPPIANKSSSESPTLAFSETMSGDGETYSSDASPVGADEAVVVAGDLTAADAGTSSAIESAYVQSSVDAQDSVTITLEEQADASAVAYVEVTDEVVASLGELAEWVPGITADETVSISLEDSVSYFSALLSSSESVTGVLEDYGLGYYPVSSNDALSVASAESVGVLKVGRERYVGLFNGDQEMTGAGYERKMVVFEIEEGIARNRQGVVWGPLAENWGTCNRVGLFYVQEGDVPFVTAPTIKPVNMEASWAYRIPKGALWFSRALLDTFLADTIVPDDTSEYLVDVRLERIDLPPATEEAMRVGEGYRRTV